MSNSSPHVRLHPENKIMDKKLKTNIIRALLSSDVVSMGGWMQIPSPEIAEILGNSDFDWVTLDLEHGSIDISDLPNIFRALELYDTLPLVRISENNINQAVRSVEAGAGGVIFPKLECASQAEELYQSINYPPRGRRGVGFNRDNCYGVNFDSELLDEPLIVGIIETKKGVEYLDMTLQGYLLEDNRIDAILIGPYDLSADLDMTGDFNNPEFKETIKHIIETCKKRNIAVGYHVVQPYSHELSQRIDEGCTFIPFGMDVTMLSHSVNIAEKTSNHKP